MSEGAREAFTSEITGDWRKPVHTKMPDLFTNPATQVMIFFADPLRVPPDCADPYPASAARGEALNIPTVLALALRTRGTEFTAAQCDHIDQPLRLFGWWERYILIRV